MKNLFLFLSLFLFKSFLQAQSVQFKWTEKEKLEKIKNLQDSTKWDKKLFSEDLNRKKSKLANENMDFGTYPVNSYRQGLGTGSYLEENYFGKKLFWNYFSSEKT